MATVKTAAEAKNYFGLPADAPVVEIELKAFEEQVCLPLIEVKYIGALQAA